MQSKQKIKEIEESTIKEIGKRVNHVVQEYGGPTKLSRDLDLNRSTLSLVINGKLLIPTSVLLRIVECLPVSADWILTGRHSLIPQD